MNIHATIDTATFSDIYHNCSHSSVKNHNFYEDERQPWGYKTFLLRRPWGDISYLVVFTSTEPCFTEDASQAKVMVNCKRRWVYEHAALRQWALSLAVENFLGSSSWSPFGTQPHQNQVCDWQRVSILRSPRLRTELLPKIHCIISWTNMGSIRQVTGPCRRHTVIVSSKVLTGRKKGPVVNELHFKSMFP